MQTQMYSVRIQTGLPVSAACRLPHNPWFPVTSIQVTTRGALHALGHDHKCGCAKVIL